MLRSGTPDGQVPLAAFPAPLLGRLAGLLVRLLVRLLVGLGGTATTALAAPRWRRDGRSKSSESLSAAAGGRYGRGLRPVGGLAARRRPEGSGAGAATGPSGVSSSSSGAGRASGPSGARGRTGRA